MHNVFGGNSKKLSELWFDPKYAGEDFNISHLVKIADERLSTIKPPSFVTRRPRSIETHSPYWKISEHYYWFFDYSIPVLSDLLPPLYFEHYKCYVLAMRILHSSEITHEMQLQAQQLIHELLSRFSVLYGERNETCNAHCTAHLVEITRRFGPIWTVSCFLLENLNGTVKDFVTSSKKPELQTFSNLDLHIKLHTLRYEWLKPNTIAYTFFENTIGPKRRMKLIKIDDTVSAVGKVSRLKSTERLKILTENNLNGSNVFSFRKIYKQKMIFTSADDERERETESHYVKFKCRSRECDRNLCFGIVLRYYHVTNCICDHVCACTGKSYALIKKLRTQLPFSVCIPGASIEYIHECLEVLDLVQPVKIHDIIDICFHVTLENGKSYICESINNFGVE
ncbi:hypothetical protein QAD02_004891 [Eretmocerus hayati]|uniref:Uncharacterized protein n=1 Tax=Eretmocerus hayati TaxID=131215 RepID=A0ACC2NQV5_9HYME|nr:hypothetical protein QAD02_004891 [Eretmocerus hayati]